MCMKNENEKTQEVLASYTSEELLYEVHKRQDVYISGWYNADHINKRTGLQSQYCPVFIKWAGDIYHEGDVELAVERWVDIMKSRIKQHVDKTFAEGLDDKFKNLYSIEYDADLGFYPELDNYFFSSTYDILRINMIVQYKPHQGNIKTYLEEAMQEFINDYLVY